MFQLFKKERMWRDEPIKKSYDIVIAGAGVHGLAIAYYLGQKGITNVAVLDKGISRGRGERPLDGDYPGQLRNPRGHSLLQRKRKDVRRPVAGAGVQPAFQPDGSAGAGAHGVVGICAEA